MVDMDPWGMLCSLDKCTFNHDSVEGVGAGKPVWESEMHNESPPKPT
jgi:hypothetical protein